MLNIQGMNIQSQIEHVISGKNRIEIQTANLAVGWYTLQMIIDDQVLHQKIMIQK